MCTYSVYFAACLLTPPPVQTPCTARLRPSNYSPRQYRSLLLALQSWPPLELPEMLNSLFWCLLPLPLMLLLLPLLPLWLHASRWLCVPFRPLWQPVVVMIVTQTSQQVGVQGVVWPSKVWIRALG